ncbi:unnamed protein product [Xyrichtys novacula]|uniref:Unnamed protein product n=1 Tax=Xyrichtys novacula TaxID=13765 RepID=A0AAV1HRZ4_XYRNO|nr:unnamed protein product [Xyrichtys novacula]
MSESPLLGFLSSLQSAIQLCPRLFPQQAPSTDKCLTSPHLLPSCYLLGAGQFGSEVHGKYAPGTQCWRVDDNPRVTPRYRRRLPVKSWLCLLSLSPSQLNAYDCTAHRQKEVSSQRCITTLMFPTLCWSTRGVKV